MLHRDLKPSNVIVVDHRVVVLDFGLVRQLSLEANTLTEDGRVAGTPAYMAPEQLLGKELTAAADWYAFGVMLYEAVCGELPIGGSLLELLRAKTESEPPALSDLVPGVPRWVSDLCASLLQRDPTRRATVDEILSLFDPAEPTGPITLATEHVPHTEIETREANSQLFGRERELEQLWDAFERAQEGTVAVAHVRAASGAGKSALVEHFVETVQHQSGISASALVLRSRCY